MTVGTRPYSLLLAVSFAVVITVGACLVYGQFGSVRAARAFIEGRDLVVASHVIDVGTLTTRDLRVFQIKLTNLTARPYSVVGTGSMCRCSLYTPLPLIVPPGGEVMIDAVLKLPSDTKTGPGECVVELVTDAPSAVLLRQVVRYTVR